MTKFTDLDLEHKRQLLLNFRIQNALAYEIVESRQVSIETLITGLAEDYFQEVESFSESEVNFMVEHIEALFVEYKKIKTAKLN